MAARLWDAQSGQELYALPSPGEAQNQNVAFSPDGRHALVGDGTQRRPLDGRETWQEVRRICRAHVIQHVLSSPIPRMAKPSSPAPSTKPRGCGTWPPGSKSASSTCRMRVGWEFDRFSPDGKLLADWHLGRSGPLSGISQPGDQIRTPARAQRSGQYRRSRPDGHYLLSGGGDGTRSALGRQTGQEVRRFVVSGNASDTFAPNRRMVAPFYRAMTHRRSLCHVDYHVTVQHLCYATQSATSRTMNALSSASPTLTRPAQRICSPALRRPGHPFRRIRSPSGRRSRRWMAVPPPRKPPPTHKLVGHFVTDRSSARLKSG